MRQRGPMEGPREWRRLDKVGAVVVALVIAFVIMWSSRKSGRLETLHFLCEQRNDQIACDCLKAEERR